MPVHRARSIGIVGGGIGGLSAALSLLAAGFDVQVYERGDALNEVGAGVQVSANASRVLFRLGLAEALAATAVRPAAIDQRRWDDGRLLLRSPLGSPLEAAFGFPHYVMHRADLLSALATAIPAARIHLGHRLTDFEQHPDGVRAEFADGTRADHDVLVGADGIRSLVHGRLFGPERPRFTGCVAYRGLVPTDRLRNPAIEPTAQAWLGPGRHFVHYPVSSGRLLNFVAVVEQNTWTRESWTDRGEVGDALAAFEGWHPQIQGILNAVDETFIWALFDRRPLEHWSSGRVTLLGDACHAMLPFMAQGAAQAIEDGATLAACLAAARDAGAERGRDAGLAASDTGLAGALREYERRRLPRTTRLQEMSAANKTRFHLPDGPDQQARDAAMATGTTDFAFKAMSWIYGHDATAPSP